MSILDENLVEKVLSLSEDQRTELIDKIMESLNKHPNKEIETIWAEEAEHRYKRYKSGQTTMIDGEEVFKKLKKRI